MSRAVVFAYHNVGVRCLSVLLAHGLDVPLVITHKDNPDEDIWFASVAELARRHDIEVITPIDANTPDVMAKIAATRPDFLFSFYYRQMLKPALLQLAPRGAYNMHGSLLPKYRGRVPVNWAVIHGERSTGATLHEMLEKPDAGRILARQAVPILPNDTAFEVFNKVTVAAEIALDRVLPDLLAGTATPHTQNLGEGSYFGGRKAEDGRIDWYAPAAQIHNLVRAVAPPYPGAFFDLDGKRVRVLATLITPLDNAPSQPAIFTHGVALYARCGDGGILKILSAKVDDHPLNAANCATLLGGETIPLNP